MEFKGKIVDLLIDGKGNYRIAIETPDFASIKADYDRVSQLDACNIKIVKYSEKRSLNANAYFHLLVGKIAQKLRRSDVWVKNQLLAEYGALELVGGQLVYITTDIPPDRMSEFPEYHLRIDHVDYEDGEKYTYTMVRGSHTYNTEEMSKLIDGTVQQAQELGIETMTPDEIERIKALWQE